MFNKNIFFVFFALCFSTIIAQTKNNEWQVGVGASVTQFSDEDALFIGDKYQFQIPRINVTMPLSDNLAIDAALTFQTLDFGFITNDAKYFSFDASLRYFHPFSDIFMPYVFGGVSIANSGVDDPEVNIDNFDPTITTSTVGFDISPTFNIGLGATIWVNEVLGFNTQVYYKHSLNSFEGMRSHVQITGGMVFALNLFDLFFNGKTSSGFCR